MCSFLYARSIAFLPALALTVGIGQSALADEFSDRATRIGQIASEASGRMSRLQGAALSRAQSLHGELLAKKLELDRVASDLSTRQSKIAEQQRTNQFRKVEWETAEAAYKRFAEDYQRKQAELKNEADALKRDGDAYQRDVNDHNQKVREFDSFVAPLHADLRAYDQDVFSHNRDAQAQRDAVAYFNSLPANQRSQAEADRLNRWRDTVNNRKANLDYRRGNLNARVADSNGRRQVINDRKAQLDARAAQLRSRGQALTQRAQNLITTDGRTMLDLRLAASTRQRAYAEGNTELQRLQTAQQQQVGIFNTAGSQADALANSLQAAIAQTGTTSTPAGQSGTVAPPIGQNSQQVTPPAANPLHSMLRHRPVDGAVQSTQQNRSVDLFNRVINQFEVGTNPRYAPVPEIDPMTREQKVDPKTKRPVWARTFCNIFVSDVTRAMGAEIPHVVDGEEQRVLGMQTWLANQGRQQGWRKVLTSREAQEHASQGRPAVVCGHGHIAIVRPGGTPQNPSIAQAGSSRFQQGSVTTGWRGTQIPDLEYWIHD